MIECGDLRNRIAVYQSRPELAENGETDYIFSEIAKIWANIVPISGGNTEFPGDTAAANVTHRITIREPKTFQLTSNTCFMYRDQRLDVLYWYPIYNRAGWMEVFCRLEIE